MRSAASRAAHWRDAVKECLRQIGPSGDTELGFVYFLDHFADDAQRLLDHLRASPPPCWWACSCRETSLTTASFAMSSASMPTTACRP